MTSSTTNTFKGLTPIQEVAWCRTVLRRAVIRTATKYRRWDATEEFANISTIISDENVVDLISDPQEVSAFDNVDLHLVIDSLPAKCRQVIRAIYDYGLTQRQAAERFGVSQSLISRWHQLALRELTKAAWTTVQHWLQEETRGDGANHSHE